MHLVDQEGEKEGRLVMRQEFVIFFAFVTSTSNSLHPHNTIEARKMATSNKGFVSSLRPITPPPVPNSSLSLRPSTSPAHLLHSLSRIPTRRQLDKDLIQLLPRHPVVPKFRNLRFLLNRPPLRPIRGVGNWKNRGS